jgi:hypothetical protein
MKTIEEQAFAECTSLVKLIIPDSVETIGKDAFAKCNLSSITWRGKAYNSNVKNLFNKAVGEEAWT